MILQVSHWSSGSPKVATTRLIVCRTSIMGDSGTSGQLVEVTLTLKH